MLAVFKQTGYKVSPYAEPIIGTMTANGYNALVDEIFLLRHLLAEMWFAYTNKDDGFPHDFELLALEHTVNYFAPNDPDKAWDEMGKYLKQEVE